MTKRNFFTLMLLALLFAAPGLTAYLYYRNPQWLTADNKGELLKPPVFLSAIEDGRQKWRFVLWYPHPCHSQCLQMVDKLARIRLALGRHLYKVDQWLLLNEKNQFSLQSLQEQDIHLSHLSKSSLNQWPILADKPKVFIASPRGYLVLAYKEDAKPNAIYHDIKRLLDP